MLLSRTTRPFGKGLRNSCTKSSQIHQWVSQHFPNQLVYCVSDRLLANTSFCDHCHNRSSSWEWTNWHMTFSHSTVLLSRFVAQKWKCFAAFLQGLPFQIERILRQVSDLKKTLNPTLFTCGSHQILCTLTNGKFPNDILPENVKSTLGLSQKSPGTSDQARQTVLPNQATRFRTWTL